MEVNPFEERYRQISDVELLRILDQKEDYQALAVSAAEKEYELRGIDAKRLAEIKAEITAEKKKTLDARLEKFLQPTKLSATQKNKVGGSGILDYEEDQGVTVTIKKQSLIIPVVILSVIVLYILAFISVSN